MVSSCRAREEEIAWSDSKVPFTRSAFLALSKWRVIDKRSNDESGSSGSPEVKKEETDSFGGVKCFSCHRTTDYGIVSSSFEQPRCQECFDALRNQAGALPATVSSLPSWTITIVGGCSSNVSQCVYVLSRC
ncbi:hypothetical protein GCK32_019924 [Trichostrongylus colubriformis]|uniref:Uncharacterized protein n=1 Tax=Trichostrongylus colubriformis TaxID=6319 RepID=A0AAN8FW54_TRICO